MYHSSSKPISGQVNTGIAKATYDLTRLMSQAQTAQAHGATAARGAGDPGCKPIIGPIISPLKSGNPGAVSPSEYVAAAPPLARTATGHETDSADHTPAVGHMVAVTAKKAATASPPHNPDTSIKCDCELARIAVGLRFSAQYRLWLVIQEHARQTGYNWLTRDHLRALLDRYQIRYSEQNLTRWLYRGHGRFWQLAGERIWLVGYEKLSAALVDLALTLPKPKRGFDPLNLVITNNPGFYRSVYINVTSDNLSQFEAAVFSGWLTAKENPSISNYVLSLLFRRDPKVIRRWVKIANVTILHTFAHYTEETSNYVPMAADGEGHRGDVLPYKVNGRNRWSATYSNTYQPQPTRQHPYRGQSLTVSRKAHQQLKSVQAAGPTVQIPYRDGRLHRTGRKLFDDAKLARANVDAEHPREQYLVKSIDNRRCIHMECVPDGQVRTRARECERASVVWEGYS